jgi:hypothetical protein
LKSTNLDDRFWPKKNIEVKIFTKMMGKCFKNILSQYSRFFNCQISMKKVDFFGLYLDFNSSLVAFLNYFLNYLDRF